MKINPDDFRVPAGQRVDLKKWPTLVKPAYKSKKQYKHLLAKHVEELSRSSSFTTHVSQIRCQPPQAAPGNPQASREVERAARFRAVLANARTCTSDLPNSACNRRSSDWSRNEPGPDILCIQSIPTGRAT